MWFNFHYAILKQKLIDKYMLLITCKCSNKRLSEFYLLFIQNINYSNIYSNNITLIFYKKYF